ncbi:hypothetical protein D915_008685 [Fasciola hepatica]|uniref:RING-type domain-containing protein n=1 Tax=Fasciola hepatica TaxID=6192 RepID=A0A4E0QZJ7_FASHE|nr:hypothetical protein D915_008685 [Fasciola hepatica]
MHNPNKLAHRQKLHQSTFLNLQFITEVDVCSMPPPSKQAKISSTNQNIHGYGTESAFTVSTDLPKEQSNSSESEISQNNQHEREEQALQEIVRSLLTCAVCLDVPRQAFQCSNGHLICIHCATRLLQQHSPSDAVCPSCRTPLQFGLRRCLLAEQLAAELPSNCRFCGSKMVRKLTELHETTICPSRPVTCRFSVVGCPWSGKWNQLESHTVHCAYKEKRLHEVESVLVAALDQNQIWQAERNQFSRGLLTRLAKSPGGLKAFRKPVGVSRETQSPESEEGIATYQSTSNLFRCCGLKRVTLEVTINYIQGELRYRVKSKSEQASEILFCLCLVRCGDAEFDVNDQLHSFRFSPNQKESPDYLTKLIYHRTTESCSSTRKTLDQISAQNWYFGFPLENLKNASNLILEFIAFKDRNDIFDGNNNEFSTHSSNILQESLEAENPGPESSDVPNVSNLAQEVANANGSTSSYWHQVLQTPTNSLLRPLLNLFFANQDQGTGNNNAPLVIGSLPQSMVFALTNLSPTDARIRLIELGTVNESSQEDTENDESDDNLSEEDAANTTEEDEEEETDSEDDPEVEDEATNPNGEVTREERNNNALNNEQEEDGCRTYCQQNKHRYAAKTKKSFDSNHSISRPASSQKSCSCVEKSRGTNHDHKCGAGSSLRRKILQPRRQTRRIQSGESVSCCQINNPRRLNRNRNMSGENQEGVNVLKDSVEQTTSRKRRNFSVGDDSVKRSILDNPSNPNTINDVAENRTGPTTIPKLHSQRWLNRVIGNITRIARFFVRPHVATPLAYLISTENRVENRDSHHSQSASENHCQNTISTVNPADMQKTMWTLPINENPIVTQNNSAGYNEDSDNKTVYLPVDSLQPAVRSFRADISGEVIHLAKRFAGRHYSTPAAEKFSETLQIELSANNTHESGCQVCENIQYSSGCS